MTKPETPTWAQGSPVHIANTPHFKCSSGLYLVASKPSLWSGKCSDLRQPLLWSHLAAPISCGKCLLSYRKYPNYQGEIRETLCISWYSKEQPSKETSNLEGTVKCPAGLLCCAVQQISLSLLLILDFSHKTKKTDELFQQLLAVIISSQPQLFPWTWHSQQNKLPSGPGPQRRVLLMYLAAWSCTNTPHSFVWPCDTSWSDERGTSSSPESQNSFGWIKPLRSWSPTANPKPLWPLNCVP